MPDAGVLLLGLLLIATMVVLAVLLTPPPGKLVRATMTGRIDGATGEYVGDIEFTALTPSQAADVTRTSGLLEQSRAYVARMRRTGARNVVIDAAIDRHNAAVQFARDLIDARSSASPEAGVRELLGANAADGEAT
ncbi:MAG: hypothetical protein AB7K09_11880 [Planctomycetota bacterium]